MPHESILVSKTFFVILVQILFITILAVLFYLMYMFIMILISLFNIIVCSEEIITDTQSPPFPLLPIVIPAVVALIVLILVGLASWFFCRRRKGMTNNTV